ncbi:MAG TPA: universal stress protein, partial [Planctomycetota bacterium]|nr:universal stress protein [Planctomycetota bacterium]
MYPHGLKILIPLDGSSTSEAILPALKPLIQSRQITSTLLHIAGSPGESGSVIIRLEALRQELEAQGVSARVLI